MEKLRQERYLAGDARLLQEADLTEAVTLAETDLLRALHRLPGVSAEDDWSAEPWVRSGRWDETRVYFDGLPLFDPTHAGGAFTSVSPDAVGTLSFHPGVRPVDLGAASGSVVDLRSRPVTGDGPLSGLAQLSVLSGRFSVDKPLGPGNGVSLSGRRSYIGEVTRGSSAENRIPIRFFDVSGRWDHRLGDSLRLEVSGLMTEDRIYGDLAHELKGARARWGNEAARVTLESLHGGVRTRITHGGSTYESKVDVVPFDADRDDLADAATASPTWNRVGTELDEVTIAQRTTGGEPPAWRVGGHRLSTRVDYRGPAPWPFPDAVNAGTLEQTSDVARYSLWGELRRAVSSTVDVQVGMALESRGVGSPFSGRTRASPRLHAAWRPDGDLRVTAAVGRHIQYEQALSAAGFEFGPALGPGHLWVSARGRLEPVGSDLATLGVERWLGEGWLASTALYARSTSGRLTPNPDSGYVRARPPVDQAELGDGWVSSDATAYGLELSLRKLTGRWTGSAAYSLSRARTTVGGQDFHTPGARAHVLDAAVLYTASRTFRLGGALTAASGAPFTRFYAFRCPEQNWYCGAADLGDPPVVGFKEPAGQERTPAYVSLDLHLEKTGRVLSRPFGFYVHLRNALGADNRLTYVGSRLECADAQGSPPCTARDSFDAGFPTLPLVGLWVRW